MVCNLLLLYFDSPQISIQYRIGIKKKVLVHEKKKRLCPVLCAKCKHDCDLIINKHLGFYDVKNFLWTLVKVRLFHSIYHHYVILVIFLAKILFEDCLHCNVFLNEWTLLNDENKVKNKYMKSWEKDKLVDNKTL